MPGLWRKVEAVSGTLLLVILALALVSFDLGLALHQPTHKPQTQTISCPKGPGGTW